MKQGYVKKAVVTVLAGAMMLSCASCALLQGTGNKDKEAVVDAAYGVANALVKMDAGKLSKYTDDSKTADNLLDTEQYSEYQAEFINTVAKTMSYEIDEDSVKIDKDEASVDVKFTMADYEKALEGADLTGIDDVTDAIKGCDDTKDVNITFEFKKDDEDWKLSNLDDKSYGGLYDFCSYELELGPDLLSLITNTEILDGAYCIDAYVYFSEDISGFDAQFTFDVYYEGDLVASDIDAYVIGTYVWCDYCDPNYENLASGEYELAVKCNGADFTTLTITMDGTEAQPTSATASGVASIDAINSAYREIMTTYESEMRTVENVSFGSIDSCALGDITGDGYPELVIVYCTDDEYGMSASGDYFTVADIRIYTVIPGETTATEMLHVSQAFVNVAGGFYTDIVLLSNGNLLVEQNGGDEDWSYSYTEYYLDGYTWQPLYTMDRYSYPSEDYTTYFDEYSINGTSATEAEFNAAIDDYISKFSSVLVMDPFYGGEYSTATGWSDGILKTPSNILSYDEAWEVTA